MPRKLRSANSPTSPITLPASASAVIRVLFSAVVSREMLTSTPYRPVNPPVSREATFGATDV